MREGGGVIEGGERVTIERQGARQPRGVVPTVATAPGPQSMTGSEARVLGRAIAEEGGERREGFKRGRDPSGMGGF